MPMTITQDILSVAEDSKLGHTNKVSRINDILKQLMEEREKDGMEPEEGGFAAV